MKVLTHEQIINSEQAAVRHGISYCELMRRAGNAATEIILNRYRVINKTVMVICGNGNNGGDGFVIAAGLARAGAKVRILLPLGEPKTPTAQENYLLPDDITVADAFDADCDYIIDALFGIGLNRAVDGDLGELIDRINLSDAVRIAVDVPSGVFCDGGACGKAVYAELTVTMIALKPCFLLPPSSEYCGVVEVADIGAEPVGYEYLTTEMPSFRKRAKNSHKGSFGTALLLCGSYGMCGAEILALRAALRSGVGIARAVVCDKNYTAVCTAVPEAVTVPVPTSSAGGPVVSENLFDTQLAECDALLIGCGIGQSYEAKRLMFLALNHTNVPTVLDADGINAVCGDINIIKRVKAPVILTPHPGEMARLCHVSIADVENDRIGLARRFAAENSCIMVLKGANTVIAVPDGRVFFNMTGNPGMATGGSGDVLSGMIVSLLAQGVSPLKATLDAVYLHGRAGDLAAQRLSQRSMLPSDITDELKTLL